MASFIKTLFTDYNTVRPVYAGVERFVPNVKCPSKKVETVVIGAGLLGLSTALELSEAGQDVVVFDANQISDGQIPSVRSGGQLWPGYAESFIKMRKLFGDNLAISAWNLTHEALGVVHQRINTRADKCEFRPGVLLTSKTTPQAERLVEAARLYKDSGFAFATFLTAEQIKKNYVNTDFYLNGILYQGDEGQQYGHLNPMKYTQTVAQLAQHKGAEIIEESPAQAVDMLPDGSYLVTTPHGRVRAQNVVFATGVDFMRPKGIGYDIMPRTYVPAQTVILVTEPITEKLAREMIPGDACFCDAANIAMNYGRLIPEPGRDGYYRLTLGGADALAQVQVALEIRKVEKEMRLLFPQLERDGIRIEHVWGGNCDLSRTALPSLTNPRDGIYHASGFSCQGMVNTALYGRAIAERILGNDTGKFETLKQLNADPYASNALIAWAQAARTHAPVMLDAYREDYAEKPLRAARAVAQASGPSA